MKIKLTDEQISMLIDSEKEQLTKQLQKDVEALNKQFNQKIELLKKKYDSVEVDINIHQDEPDTSQQKKKVSSDELIAFFKEGLKNTEIALKTGYNSSYISMLKKKYKDKELI
jgi:hypothetical protein